MKKLLVFIFSVLLLGSCQRDVEGCTDINATNYSSDATVDDGSCLYPVTNIPDTAFEQALIDLGYDDIIDGSVVTSNIINVDTLILRDLNNSSVSFNIQSLEGIEAFINLTYLNCYNNLIENLDMSQNTALTELFCINNQLTSIDLSNNPNLISLNVVNNQLTNLDVNTNILLEGLACGENQLTSIDLSNNPNLISLNVVNNQLTNLDVTANSLLWQLFCSANQLTSLDVSQNNSLGYLFCQANQLTSLNVTANTLLTNINVNYNQLTGLNLSQNTDLESIECTNNQLSCLNLKNGNNTNLNGVPQLYNNPNLSCIEVDDVSWANNWTSITASGVTFSTNCNYPAGCF
jgi:trimeric autotransporter adhesin